MYVHDAVLARKQPTIALLSYRISGMFRPARPRIHSVSVIVSAIFRPFFSRLTFPNEELAADAINVLPPHPYPSRGVAAAGRTGRTGDFGSREAIPQFRTSALWIYSWHAVYRMIGRQIMHSMRWSLSIPFSHLFSHSLSVEKCGLGVFHPNCRSYLP